MRAASCVDPLGDLVDVLADGGQSGVHLLDIRGVKLDDIPVYRHLPQIRAVPPCGELRHLFIYEPLFHLTKCWPAQPFAMQRVSSFGMIYILKQTRII